MLEIILRHSKLVTEAIQQTMELKHFSPEDEALAETVKEVGSGGGWVMVCGSSNSVELFTGRCPGAISILCSIP